MTRRILILIFSAMIINLFEKIQFCHCTYIIQHRHGYLQKSGFYSQKRFVRIFNPGISGYVRNHYNKLLIMEHRDMTSSSLIWEYIPSINRSVVLRHKNTKRFLCFNRKGRPTLKKKVNSKFCHLSIQHTQSHVRILLKNHSWYVAFCRNGFPLTYRRKNSKCNSTKPVFFSFKLCPSLPLSCLSKCKENPFRPASKCPTSCQHLLLCSTYKAPKRVVHSSGALRILALIRKMRQR